MDGVKFTLRDSVQSLSKCILFNDASFVNTFLIGDAQRVWKIVNNVTVSPTGTNLGTHSFCEWKQLFYERKQLQKEVPKTLYKK